MSSQAIAPFEEIVARNLREACALARVRGFHNIPVRAMRQPDDNGKPLWLLQFRQVTP